MYLRNAFSVAALSLVLVRDVSCGFLRMRHGEPLIVDKDPVVQTVKPATSSPPSKSSPPSEVVQTVKPATRSPPSKISPPSELDDHLTVLAKSSPPSDLNHHLRILAKSSPPSDLNHTKSSATVKLTKQSAMRTQITTMTTTPFVFVSQHCQCQPSSKSWSTPAPRKPKCIFIDLGANNGETYKAFLGKSSKWTYNYDAGGFDRASCDAYLIEANPVHGGALEFFRSDHVHPLVGVATYMCDKQHETFNVVKTFGADSSLNKTYTGADTAPVQVEMQNLMRLLTEVARPEDHVVVKMDVEGAEYDILPCLAASPAAKLIDSLYVEDHCPPHGTASWDYYWCHSTGSAGVTRERFQSALQSLRHVGVHVPPGYQSPMMLLQTASVYDDDDGNEETGASEELDSGMSHAQEHVEDADDAEVVSDEHNEERINEELETEEDENEAADNDLSFIQTASVYDDDDGNEAESSEGVESGTSGRTKAEDADDEEVVSDEQDEEKINEELESEEDENEAADNNEQGETEEAGELSSDLSFLQMASKDDDGTNADDEDIVSDEHKEEKVNDQLVTEELQYWAADNKEEGDTEGTVEPSGELSFLQTASVYDDDDGNEAENNGMTHGQEHVEDADDAEIVSDQHDEEKINEELENEEDENEAADNNEQSDTEEAGEPSGDLSFLQMASVYDDDDGNEVQSDDGEESGTSGRTELSLKVEDPDDEEIVSDEHNEEKINEELETEEDENEAADANS